jgi:PAS domain-containing protein
LKANEQTLTETAKHLEQAQTISQLGNWSFGLKDNTTTWSRQMYVMFRVDPASFTPTFDSFMKAVHKEDRALVESALKAALTTGTPHQLEHRVVLTGGQVKWLLQRGHTELDAQGKPARLVGTVQDITERKLSETALAQSHDLLKTIVETMPMRVFWKNTDLRYLGCNTAFARDAGKQTPADLDWPQRPRHGLGGAGRSVSCRRHGRDGQRRASHCLRRTANHTRWSHHLVAHIQNSAQRPSRSQIVGVLGLYEDITQQKRDDERLKKLSLVAEQSPFGIAITDLQERFEYVNPAFTRKTGYAAAELLGNTPRMMHSGMNGVKAAARNRRTRMTGPD